MYDNDYVNYSNCVSDTSCPANFDHRDWWPVNPQKYKVAGAVWGGTDMYAPPQGMYYNGHIGMLMTMKHYNPKGWIQTD